MICCPYGQIATNKIKLINMLKDKQFIKYIIVGIFIFGVIYLYSHLLIVQGVQKEREHKECVGAVAISEWQNALNMAKEICINGPKNQMQVVTEVFEKEKDDIIKEREYWRNSYFWLKQQAEEEALPAEE